MGDTRFFTEEELAFNESLKEDSDISNRLLTSKEQRVNLFKEELSQIEDNFLRNVAMAVLGELPEYFFLVASSSSARFHPQFALGDGGLVRHTKACIHIACSLLENKLYSQLRPFKSIIVTSLLLHDGLKGGSEYKGVTYMEHPLWMSQVLRQEYPDSDVVEEVAKCIETHMGEWTFDKDKMEHVLREPSTDIEKFVHLCDYLSSRKCFCQFDFTTLK